MHPTPTTTPHDNAIFSTWDSNYDATLLLRFFIKVCSAIRYRHSSHAEERRINPPLTLKKDSFLLSTFSYGAVNPNPFANRPRDMNTYPLYHLIRQIANGFKSLARTGAHVQARRIPIDNIRSRIAGRYWLRTCFDRPLSERINRQKDSQKLSQKN